MEVKEDFINMGSFIIGNGKDTRFGKDTWQGNESLAEQYPSLYNIVQCKQVSVANVLNQNPLNITFGHTLTKNHWRLRLQLVYRLMLVQANNEKDIFCVGLYIFWGVSVHVFRFIR
jgi:hypothetical protein